MTVTLVYRDPTDPDHPLVVGPFPDHETAFEYGSGHLLLGDFWTTEMEAPSHAIT